MPSSLSNFRTRIRRYLKETSADTSFWTDAFINQLFNAQYRRRCAQLIMAHEGWFATVATRDLEDGKDRYAFPDGFLRLLKLELVRTDGRTVPIRRFERHEGANPNEGAADDEYLPTWRPLGNGFRLEPEPQSDVTDGIRMEYAALPANLSADGDSVHPSFPEIYEELLALDTVVACFDAEGVMQETGLMRSLLRLRAEWEMDWERFIDTRVVARQRITPFAPHYHDA